MEKTPKDSTDAIIDDPANMQEVDIMTNVYTNLRVNHPENSRRVDKDGQSNNVTGPIRLYGRKR